ncbi:hypothetical protein BCR39DRAFT_548624 [Naematelia encephala]|uniref:Uncharacterized protein n=1 Tax=Naematelia encephala TaxID=71784 RepID=A0A1Y2AMK8_9TREE|nr:hypothetical protein BCR39DRAFT_548624 [Naematelia encephala]
MLAPLTISTTPALAGLTGTMRARHLNRPASTTLKFRPLTRNSYLPFSPRHSPLAQGRRCSRPPDNRQHFSHPFSRG